jgi:hypothetical protein
MRVRREPGAHVTQITSANSSFCKASRWGVFTFRLSDTDMEIPQIEVMASCNHPLLEGLQGNFVDSFSVKSKYIFTTSELAVLCSKMPIYSSKSIGHLQ